MKPLEYLFFAISLGCYKKLQWIVSVFTVSVETESQAKSLYPGKLIREPFGLFFYDEKLEKKQLIVDSEVVNRALFHKYDKITINGALLGDRGGFVGVGDIHTTIGRLLLNLLVVYEPFQGKMKYINDSFTPGSIEKKIAPVLKDTVDSPEKKSPNEIYVDEYIKFCSASTFVESMSKIFSQSITEQGILPAPGREEFRKKVIEKYKGKLHDPIEMVKFQTELKEFDQEYLKKNDPAYGKFMSGTKILGARAKAYMTQGGEINEFTGDLNMTPITQPLTDGIDLTAEKFVATSNTIRYGSFARGAETVNGGVVAKALMTALDTWRVVDGDCKTTLGVHRRYDEKEISKLVGRFIVLDGKATFIENSQQAALFVDKTVIIRSPQYCRKPGTNTCEICAGMALSKFKNGLVIPAMEVSSGIMSDSLKKMHNTTASTKQMELKSVIS